MNAELTMTTVLTDDDVTVDLPQPCPVPEGEAVLLGITGSIEP